MGAPRVEVAVCDSGPLIHLAEINGFYLLDIFSVLHIPAAVWSETVGRERVLPAAFAVKVMHHLVPPAELASFTLSAKLGRLHSGERECLFICHEHQIPLLLTDDLAVRETAQRLGVMPVGCLGIAVKAYRTGSISRDTAAQLMRALYETSSLFVTRTIVDLAIEQLRSI